MGISALEEQLDTVVLIPAYKPEEILVELCRTLTENGLQVLIVDDGSGPAFHSVFHSCKDYADVLGYEQNRGKGYALKYGLAHIRDQLREVQYVVTADADGQHAVKDILACAAAVREQQCLILGSRAFTGKVPFKSRAGNFLTRFAYAVACSSYLGDNQTGLRAFTVRDIDWMLFVEGDRYEYELNVLMAAGKRNLPIHEVRIETIYIENNRKSHFDPIRDTLRLHGKILISSAGSLLAIIQGYLLGILCYYAVLPEWGLADHIGAVAATAFAVAVFRSAMAFLMNGCTFFMGRIRGRRTSGHHWLSTAVRFVLELAIFMLLFLLLQMPFALALGLAWVLVAVPMYGFQSICRKKVD